MVGMGVRFMGAHSETRVEHEHPLFGPGCEKTAVLGWGRKEGVVILEGGVHILEARRGGSGWTDREAEAVCLVVVVVGVLTDDHSFDGV